MDLCFIIGILRVIILFAIGIAGLINIEYLANTYIAIVIILMGLLALLALFNQRKEK
jgi:hypothetical protein